MRAVIIAPKKKEHKKFEKKRFQQLYKSLPNVTKIMEFEKCPRKTTKYDLIVDDFTLVSLPANDSKSVKTQLKRKFANDDKDLEWSPYPRRLKLKSYQNPSMYDYDSYPSDEFDDGDTTHIVPNCKITDHGSICSHSSSEGEIDDVLNAEVIGVEMVIIDEMIQFDGLESTNNYELDESPTCFEILKLCTEEESNQSDLRNDEENAQDLLHAITKSSRIVSYDGVEDSLKDVKQIEQYSPLQCNDCWEVEDQSCIDSQIEKLKFARCFKCRQKVRHIDCREERCVIVIFL